MRAKGGRSAPQIELLQALVLSLGSWCTRRSPTSPPVRPRGCAYDPAAGAHHAWAEGAHEHGARAGPFPFAPPQALRVRHARSVGARAADPRCRHCPGRASGDRPGRRPHAGHQQRDGLARETAKPAVRHGAATWASAWRGHPTSARHARVRDRGRGQCFYESWSQRPDM